MEQRNSNFSEKNTSWSRNQNLLNRSENFNQLQTFQDYGPRRERQVIPGPPPLPQKRYSLRELFQKFFNVFVTYPFITGLLLGQVSMFLMLNAFALQTNEYFLKAMGLL